MASFLDGELKFKLAVRNSSACVQNDFYRTKSTNAYANIHRMGTPLQRIQENEGDDQSIDSLEISEPGIDVPEAPTPEPAPAPAPAASRPTRDRHPPDFLSPKMLGQYNILPLTL